ncbi:MAG: YfiR family protein [Bryobacteraceae bacterium]
MLTRLIIAAAVLTTLMVPLQGQVDEYEVKAFFLFHFAKYVEWPASSFKNGTDPIVICILGENPFGGALERAIAGKLVEGHPFVVRQIATAQQPVSCHILFVGSAERKRFHSIASSLKNSGVLTVGEFQGFTTDGGVINFKLDEGKVRFEINQEAAERAGLHISSRLLSLAQVGKK